MFEGHDYSKEPNDRDRSKFDDLIHGTYDEGFQQFCVKFEGFRLHAFVTLVRYQM